MRPADGHAINASAAAIFYFYFVRGDSPFIADACAADRIASQALDNSSTRPGASWMCHQRGRTGNAVHAFDMRQRMSPSPAPVT